MKLTVTIDVCDHPLFRRLAKERIRSSSGTFYEMDNVDDDDVKTYTDDITKAKRLSDGSYKHTTNFCYCVGGSYFEKYDDAIVHSMMLLILTCGFRKWKDAGGLNARR
ncbi:MAG: hypothetical protein PHP06_05920 [Clostridia bacterium]|nr:hypothetical protein [Clostridia bacterium]